MYVKEREKKIAQGLPFDATVEFLHQLSEISLDGCKRKKGNFIIDHKDRPVVNNSLVDFFFDLRAICHDC